MAQLQDLFKTHAVVKILDFLTLYKNFEYTRTEIAKNIGISRRTLYEVFPILEKFELVKLTKSSGMVKFYTLNTNNPIAKHLIALVDAISIFKAGKITDMDLTQLLQQDQHVKVTTQILMMSQKIEGLSSKGDQLIQGVLTGKGETSTAFTDHTKDISDETLKQEVYIYPQHKVGNQKG